MQTATSWPGAVLNPDPALGRSAEAKYSEARLPTRLDRLNAESEQHH